MWIPPFALPLQPRRSAPLVPPTGAQSLPVLGFQGSCEQSSESHLELLPQAKQNRKEGLIKLGFHEVLIDG